MNLLFIGYLHGFGGAEKMLIMLANEMANRGHDVRLIGLAEDNPCYPISDNVKYIFYKEESKGRIGRIANRFVILKKQIRDINPDLIINFNFQSTYLCYFMGKAIRGKTIYSERGDPHDYEYSGAMGVLRKYVFKKIKGFVFQTNGACDCFDETVKKRSCIIHNPVFIQQEAFPLISVREKRIVNVGRLHSQKNQSLLIDAFSNIIKDFPDYKLEIYGSGTLENQLRAKIKDLGLQKNVFLLGSFSDIHKRIQNAALFVLSSDYEGMPNALMEAMAIGIPCVSTDCRPGGARELICNGTNGLIVPCDDANSLSEAINYMISNPSLADSMGQKARNILKEHAPQVIYDKWEHFFRKCGGF